MRKRLLGSVAILSLATIGAANAATHHPKPPPAPPPPPADPWTGFYVGGNVGYGWGRSNTTANFYNSATGALLSSSSSSFTMPGPLGGAQIGYNQLANGNWLWGVETDIQAANEQGNANGKFLCSVAICQAGNPFFATGGLPQNPVVVSTFNEKIDWFGTVRGRVGTLVTPSIVAYATGGLAYGEISTSGTITGQTGTGAVTAASFSGHTTKAGWTLGCGLEGRLTAQWSAKIEYLYMDFGTVNTNGSLPTNFIPITATFSSKITDNVVRVGLNYKY
jgi:outer membrane immunogenic protein